MGPFDIALLELQNPVGTVILYHSAKSELT